jgi:hypothetical protein
MKYTGLTQGERRKSACASSNMLVLLYLRYVLLRIAAIPELYIFSFVTLATLAWGMCQDAARVFYKRAELLNT